MDSLFLRLFKKIDFMQSPSTPKYFPAPSDAETDGLLAVGGSLEVEYLIDAYRHGIFPWPVFVDPGNELILAWWSPDPRAIVEFSDFHISRRLSRSLRNTTWHVTADKKFIEVIEACSRDNDRIGNTWITPEMIDAYCELHRQGYAHSIEVMDEGQLIGGVYGVAIGGMFAAESMFYRKSGASKMALASLIFHLRACDFSLVDIQQMTPHMKACGAAEISRDAFIDRLTAATSQSAVFGDAVCWRDGLRESR